MLFFTISCKSLQTGIDILNEIGRLKNDYCTTTDPILRAVLIINMRKIKPDYKPVCEPTP